MSKIRVLVVDDAVVIRKILTDVLSEDPQIEVVGTAPNGKIALQKLTQVNPDVVTLDIEMPEMNGLEALRHMRKDFPKLPIIMFSTLTERGATATLDALAFGASDYVTKPANVGSVTNAREKVRDELISKIKALVSSRMPGIPRQKITPELNAEKKDISSLSTSRAKQAEIVAIGVSTGGPNALASALPQIPENFHLPIVIVQHMPPMFTKLLAERLNAQCKLKVVEASHEEEIKSNTIYIAPGDYHMEVKRVSGVLRTHLHQGPQECSCRPAVDVLFRSVANLFKEKAFGVVLTGMGYDGLHGSELIKQFGGQVIVQDKESSIVWGMPGAVAEAGIADAILPLASIPHEIIRRTFRSPVLSQKNTPTDMKQGVL